MTEVNGIEESHDLRNVYGEDIILLNNEEESEVFRILAEFIWKENTYAVLQSDELKKSDDVAIFRITKDDSGNLEIEIIEDDDEWEDVSELYDEMSFPNL